MTSTCRDHECRTPIRVLCADDAPDILEALRRALSQHGRIELVGLVDRADELVTLAKNSRPDVAIIDMWMPGLDPLAAIEQLRRELPTVAVLAYSGYDDPQSTAKARAAGAHGLVSKDADFGELIAAIERAAFRPY